METEKQNKNVIIKNTKEKKCAKKKRITKNVIVVWCHKFVTAHANKHTHLQTLIHDVLAYE